MGFQRRLAQKIIPAAVTALSVGMILNVPTPGAQDPKKESPEETRLIESLDGSELFRAYCAVCHGKDGKGGGPAAAALKVSVPDLTRISQRNGGKYPAMRIPRIISGEERVTPAHGSREMPVWGPIFSQIAWDQDLGKVRIYNLTQYIESLQRK